MSDEFFLDLDRIKNSTDLFEVCKIGFVASQIGSLWCSGYMPTERLGQQNIIASTTAGTNLGLKMPVKN